MPFPIPNAKSTFLDQNGVPLAAGQVFTYIPGTSNPSNTYTDETLSVANPNPIVLDQAGTCVMWGDGYFRQVVRDMFGNLIWDYTTGIEIDQIDGNLNVTGGLTVGGATNLNGNLSVAGNIYGAGSEDIQGNLTVVGYTTVDGPITANGGVNITSGGLTVNGPTNFAGGNITAQSGYCVITDCIEALTTGVGYVSVNSSMVINQSTATVNALEVRSFDLNSYTDFYGDTIVITSNDDPTLGLINTSSGIAWGITGGATLNFGLVNGLGAPQSVFAYIDQFGNMTINGTLTQNGLVTLATSPLMPDGALTLVASTPVKTLPHVGIAPADLPTVARTAVGPNAVDYDMLVAILWKAVQELNSQVEVLRNAP